MTTSLEEVDCSEDGHVAAKARCEVGNNPMNMQGIAVGVLVERPVRLKLLRFELNNLFKPLNLQFVSSLNDRFVGKMLL